MVDILQDQETWVYAQLDDESRCVGISWLSGEVINDKLISMEGVEDPNALMGKIYDKGEWIEDPNPPQAPDMLNLQEAVLSMMEGYYGC